MTLDSVNKHVDDEVEATINLIIECLELNGVLTGIAAEALFYILAVFRQRSGETVDEFLQKASKYLRNKCEIPENESN